MREDIIKEYEMLIEVFSQLYMEMKEFAKKTPNDLLNTFKLNIINNILGRIRKLLEQEPSAVFLSLLDESNLPSSSDTVLLMSQYKSALHLFYMTNTEEDEWSHDRHWK